MSRMYQTNMPYNKEKWFQFSVMEQMGNIGSDVGRAILWKNKRNLEYSRMAFESAEELFDLILSDPRWLEMKGRLKEIRMAKNVVYDFLFGENQYNETGEKLMKYFDEFTLAARKDK
ncbi:MAG: hypothetical protein HYV66_01530 [Candidatus Sungbacteria bacterium]|uniref:Uncharacterized protein n=1 Tax=Candidatus Sungiibacteriota bacterium TaxID=2750080 RepID=A0A931YDI3_9BACT|nr:hypothetical protein [Candidatus Sungbacteria bacterium]